MIYMVKLCVQLEDHFLKLGWIFLNNPNSMVDLKVCVQYKNLI